MSWEQIEARVRENDEDPKIGINPVRSEVVAALRQDSRVAPDKLSGQDKKMVFVRVGGRGGALVGIQIENKTSLGFWCDPQYTEALRSLGFNVKYKVCDRRPGSKNTGRHTALDRPSRFDDAPLIHFEVSGSAASLKVIDVVALSRIDWTNFWIGFLEDLNLPKSMAASEGNLALEIEEGVRAQLTCDASGSEVSVRLLFHGPNAESRYLRLLSLCGATEDRIGAKLNWNGRTPDSGNFSVTHSMSGADFSEQSEWTQVYRFFKNTVEKFRSSVSDIARLEGA